MPVYYNIIRFQLKKVSSGGTCYSSSFSQLVWLFCSYDSVSESAATTNINEDVSITKKL